MAGHLSPAHMGLKDFKIYFKIKTSDRFNRKCVCASALCGDNLTMRSSLKYKQQVYFEQLVLTKELRNRASFLFPSVKSIMMDRKLYLMATFFLVIFVGWLTIACSFQKWSRWQGFVGLTLKISEHPPKCPHFMWKNECCLPSSNNIVSVIPYSIIERLLNLLSKSKQVESQLSDSLSAETKTIWKWNKSLLTALTPQARWQNTGQTVVCSNNCKKKKHKLDFPLLNPLVEAFEARIVGYWSQVNKLTSLTVSYITTFFLKRKKIKHYGSFSCV